MTNKELSYQYSLAALFLATCYQRGDLDASEYVQTFRDLQQWYRDERAKPGTVRPIDCVPIHASFVAWGMANVVPFPMVSI